MEGYTEFSFPFPLTDLTKESHGRRMPVPLGISDYLGLKWRDAIELDAKHTGIEKLSGPLCDCIMI